MIDPRAILEYDFGQPEQAYDQRDAILYALGVGLGTDPLDVADLAFLDERALKVLPTFAATLCSPGMWIREERLGVTFGKLVHLAQWAEFPRPLPPAGRIRGRAEVVSLKDRGEGRGAVLVLERGLMDADSGAVYCRLRQTILLRADGGFGGEPPQREPSVVPGGDPDAVCAFTTSQRAALIYRLSGDWNPLHLDPSFARAAGFERPILHGLASYGIAGLAVSRALGEDPGSTAMLSCRFSGIVMPGDEIRFRIWRREDASAVFTAHVGERQVLDAGEIAWSV